MNAQTHGELANFIWSICNLPRGPYKRNEYRKVILPLTVLRRFDCVLADTKEDVLAAAKQHAKQSENVRHQLLAATAQRPFYNTSPFDLARLLDDPNHIAATSTPTSLPTRRTCATSWSASISRSRSAAWTRRTCCSK